MGKSGKVIVAVVIVAVVAVGAIFLMNKEEDKTTTETTPDSSTTQNQNSGDNGGGQDSGNMAADVSIKYSGSAFTLSASTIKSGGKVTVTNNSDSDLEFASDPHPVHTDNPELNTGDIAPGESKTITLTTKGKWGFHNHYQSSHKGEITVE